MRLAQFALAVGADSKWVLNACRLLDREVAYDVADARRLGLVREIQASFGTPLDDADAMAARALEQGDEVAVACATPTGVLALVVDLPRYLSDFAGRLSRARGYTPKRRGRPSRPSSGSAVERARRYGIDISLLRTQLRRSPEARLQGLDTHRAFVLDLLRARRG